MKKILAAFGAGALIPLLLAFTFTTPNSPASYSTGDISRVCFDNNGAHIWVASGGENKGKLTIRKDGEGGTTCQLQGEVADANSADCSGITEAALQARIDAAFAQGELGLSASGVSQ